MKPAQVQTTIVALGASSLLLSCFAALGHFIDKGSCYLGFTQFFNNINTDGAGALPPLVADSNSSQISGIQLLAIVLIIATIVFLIWTIYRRKLRCVISIIYITLTALFVIGDTLAMVASQNNQCRLIEKHAQIESEFNNYASNHITDEQFNGIVAPEIHVKEISGKTDDVRVYAMTGNWGEPTCNVYIMIPRSPSILSAEAHVLWEDRAAFLGRWVDSGAISIEEAIDSVKAPRISPVLLSSLVYSERQFDSQMGTAFSVLECSRTSSYGTFH